jgi:NAD(P)H dehydrogenase (quinone)
LTYFSAYHQIVTLRSAAAILFFALIPGLVSASGFYETGTETEFTIHVDSTSAASLYPDREPPKLSAFSPEDSPKALIIHADPRNDTLTAAARDGMVQFLISEGWEVEVRNLYDDDFNPVASAEEISFQKPSQGDIDPQIAEYQDLIRMADALILIYPLWWKQPPAILKGWQDRVFTYGFAYEFVNNSPDSVISLLAGKKILIINVVASSRDMYEDQGFLRYLDMADESLFGVSGMDLTERHIIYSSTDLDMEEKKECIDELSGLISLIEPLF